MCEVANTGVLIVGAGNSGVEIALDVVRNHPTWMSGSYPGHIPFRIETFAARHFLVPLVLRFFFHRVLTVHTPIGRKLRPKMLRRAGPLVRIKPSDISRAGIESLPRTVGVQAGLPLLEDGRVLDVANVIWCTGFHPGFAWIDLPVFGEEQEPLHKRGVVPSEPGLYFIGLHFLSAVSSAQIHDVGRDAAYIAHQIDARSPVSVSAAKARSLASGEQHAV